jgi:hypothetical protein
VIAKRQQSFVHGRSTCMFNTPFFYDNSTRKCNIRALARSVKQKRERPYYQHTKIAKVPVTDLSFSKCIDRYVRGHVTLLEKERLNNNLDEL